MESAIKIAKAVESKNLFDSWDNIFTKDQQQRMVTAVKIEIQKLLSNEASKDILDDIHIAVSRTTDEAIVLTANGLRHFSPAGTMEIPEDELDRIICLFRIIPRSVRRIFDLITR